LIIGLEISKKKTFYTMKCNVDLFIGTINSNFMCIEQFGKNYLHHHQILGNNNNKHSGIFFVAS